MELAAQDLHTYVKHLEESISLTNVTTIFVHVAAGVRAIHAAGLMHRDLHPKNVLMCPGDGILAKVGDLGSTCALPGATARGLTQNVTALNCRAPEILFCTGAKYDDRSRYIGAHLATYSQAVDIWAIGTILMYLDIQEYILLPRTRLGHSVVQAGTVANHILKMLGRPSPELAHREGWSFQGLDATECPSMLHDIRKKCRLFALGMQMLRYDPTERPTAANLVETFANHRGS